MFQLPFIAKKTEHISFKNGCVVRMAKYRRLVHSVALTVMA